MTIKKGLLIILGIAATAVVLTLLYLFNPVETEYAPKCVFHELTGWSCSGCGMQRFLHAMMHGRFLEAISYNYMLIILIPYTLLFGIERFILTGAPQKSLRNVVEGRLMAYVLIGVVPCWMIIRNILHI